MTGRIQPLVHKNNFDKWDPCHSRRLLKEYCLSPSRQSNDAKYKQIYEKSIWIGLKPWQYFQYNCFTVH